MTAGPIEDVDQPDERDLVFAVRYGYAIFNSGRAFYPFDEKFPIAAVGRSIRSVENGPSVFEHRGSNQDGHTSPEPTLEFEFVQLVEYAMPDQRVGRIGRNVDSVFHLKHALRIKANQARRACSKRRWRILEIACLQENSTNGRLPHFPAP